MPLLLLLLLLPLSVVIDVCLISYILPIHYHCHSKSKSIKATTAMILLPSSSSPPPIIGTDNTALPLPTQIHRFDINYGLFYILPVSINTSILLHFAIVFGTQPKSIIKGKYWRKWRMISIINYVAKIVCVCVCRTLAQQWCAYCNLSELLHWNPS